MLSDFQRKGAKSTKERQEFIADNHCPRCFGIGHRSRFFGGSSCPLHLCVENTLKYSSIVISNADDLEAFAVRLRDVGSCLR